MIAQNGSWRAVRTGPFRPAERSAPCVLRKPCPETASGARPEARHCSHDNPRFPYRGPRLARDRDRACHARLRHHRPTVHTEGMRRPRRDVRPARPLSQPRGHAAPRLRPGRVPVLREPAAAADRRVAQRAVRAPRAAGQRLGRGDGPAGRLPRGPRRLPCALPRGRPVAPHPRCCCATTKAITTACTRTCTATCSFRCSSPCC
jgi:hypothetical protein